MINKLKKYFVDQNGVNRTWDGVKAHDGFVSYILLI